MFELTPDGSRRTDDVPLPVSITPYDYNMFYIVEVPPGTHVKRHIHDESIFRFVFKGSLVLNKSIRVKHGTWFVVKANTPYEIDTRSGYVAMNVYKANCMTLDPNGAHWEEA